MSKKKKGNLAIEKAKKPLARALILGKTYSRDQILGKEVIDSSGKKIGEIKDLARAQGKTALIVDLASKKGDRSQGDVEEYLKGHILLDKIKAIGDVIFVKSVRDVKTVNPPTTRARKAG